MQKIALVTGASSGFGKEISLELAQKGFYVFAASRQMTLLNALASSNIEPILLDVTQKEHIERCIAHILHNKGKIDLLINNAGHGLYSTIEDADIADIQHQFDVNVFGPIRMTQAVLPSMRQNKSGMIINISSIAGHVTMPLFGYYAGSKHALEAISDALRMETKQFGIQTIVIEPGIFKTNFRNNALEISHQNRKTDDYEPMIKKILKYLESNYERAPHPNQIARLVTKIIESKNPKRRYVIGRGSNFLLFVKQYFGYGLLDKVMAFLFTSK